MSKDSEGSNPVEMISVPSSCNSQNYLSPGLYASNNRDGNAVELKFLLPIERACLVRDRAIKELARDPHAAAGSYCVESLYLDTPQFDAFHRNPTLNGTKYRFRRYNESKKLFLERKQKVDGIVIKKRQEFDIQEICRFLESEDELCLEIRSRSFRPSCAVQYRRDAFYDPNGSEVCRVTVDDNLQSEIFESRTWDELVSFLDGKAPSVNEARKGCSQFLFSGWSVVEFKFINTMPVRLKQWVEELRLVPMSFSKYRSAMVVGFDG